MKKILITGGAGFLGSNLCAKLLQEQPEAEIICLDNFFTGRRKNIEGLLANPRFSLLEHDVTEPFPEKLAVAEVYSLACPASPPHYQKDPVYTTKISVLGILNALELTKRCGAKLLQASTSEVYGEPQVHPQVEDYRGNVSIETYAATLGVTTAALSQTIRLATLGDIDQNSARFSLSDRQIPIRVSLSEEARRDLATIENLPVPTTTGGSVPLRSVAEISFGSGPTTIQRSNQNRRITIGADLATNPATGEPFVSSEAQEKINNTETMRNLPTGVSRLTLGQDKWQTEMVTNFLIAVVSGVFLVFAVLVLLYHRIMPPFVNMGSLLLAPLGAALALHIAGMPLSMPVFIGILMLLGIVAKNSILVVDFALEEMNKGIDKFEAILDAGRKRAQPIVMTTVAMVAGMVPTSLALTGDGAWRQPMGVTVIGGLTVSTMLTLLIVPAGFSLAVGVEQRLGPWLRKRLLTYKPGDESSGAAVPQPAE